jgi:hypothetical protein
MTTTTATAFKTDAGAAPTRGRNVNAEPLKLRKRIGSTDYIVSVRFSTTSKETLQDKLLRVIEREALTHE